MPVSVGIVGLPGGAREVKPQGHFVLRCLELATGSRVQLKRPADADIVLIYPYRFPFRSNASGALLGSLLSRVEGPGSWLSPDHLLRRIHQIPDGRRVLAIAPENLDRRPWQSFGDLLRSSSTPRLTFWPKEVDPDGFRLPYWWNYVDWPQIPRASAASSTRFGAYYDLDVLCEAQEFGHSLAERKPRAVWLTNHLDFPRAGILRSIEQDVPVDVITGLPWGKKLELLREYRYCVVSENSTGYGYETEKAPEARMAGCIPIGYVRNPFSDFASDAVFFRAPPTVPDMLPPLVPQRPALEGLLNYLATAMA